MSLGEATGLPTEFQFEPFHRMIVPPSPTAHPSELLNM
jgi:hypothetical protein